MIFFKRYFLFLSELTKKKLNEEIDEFSDSYYLNLDCADIKQVMFAILSFSDARIAARFILNLETQGANFFAYSWVSLKKM